MMLKTVAAFFRAISAAYRGDSNFRQGKLDQAIEDYTKSIELCPRAILGYVGRARAFKSQGKLDEAIIDYAKAFEVNSNNPDHLIHRGNAQRWKGNLDAAILDYAKAIELFPYYATPYHQRGEAYHARGNLEQAQADYAKASELDFKIARLHEIRRGAFRNPAKPNQAASDSTRSEVDFEKEKEQRQRLQIEYPQLFQQLSRLLFSHDPAGINFETNEDEYDPEAGAILSQLDRCSSAADIEGLVDRELRRWYGDLYWIRDPRGRKLAGWFEASRARHLRLGFLAKEIWELWGNSEGSKKMSGGQD